MSLTESQIARYERQILLPEVGGRGQNALLTSTVRVGGSGAAAEELATYLAAGGIGSLLLDPSFPSDRRQFLEALNPDVRVSSDGEADFMVDCGDSEDRFVGAQNAMKVMLECIGAGESTQWVRETGSWWSSC